MQPAVVIGVCGGEVGGGGAVYKRMEPITIVELNVWNLKNRSRAVCLLLTQSPTDSF